MGRRNQKSQDGGGHKSREGDSDKEVTDRRAYSAIVIRRAESLIKIISVDAAGLVVGDEVLNGACVHACEAALHDEQVLSHPHLLIESKEGGTCVQEGNGGAPQSPHGAPTIGTGGGIAACTRDHVAKLLEMDIRTLDALVARSEDAGIVTPVIDIGTGSRRRQVWDASRLSIWFEEVARWQQSDRGSEDGRSDGRRKSERSGGTGAGAARPSEQPGRSDGRSSTRSRFRDSGDPKSHPSPLEFAKSLVSKS